MTKPRPPTLAPAVPEVVNEATISGSAADPITPRDRELQLCLRAAYAPEALDPERGEELLLAALDRFIPPPSLEEQAEAEQLRRALETGEDHPLADLGRALQAAHHPTDLAERAHQQHREQSLFRYHPPERRSPLRRLFPQVVVGLALAAGLALLVQAGDRWTGAASEGARQSTGALSLDAYAPALSRSSAPLFRQRFEVKETSARIDRIALARARDLRENRYAAWGVR